jgi:carboxyl-terminal processing protease
MQHTVLLLVLQLSSSATFPAAGNAQGSPTKSTAPSAPGSPLEIRQKTFDIVWRTVKDELFDPAIRGVDWEAAKRRYAPRVETAKSDEKLYELLNDMVGELHLSHLGVISYEDASKQTSALGAIGVDIRIIENQAVVVHVDKSSPADKAGMRPGYIVTHISGESIDRIARQLPKRDRSPRATRAVVTQRLLERLQGDPGSAVTVAYLDESNKEHEKKIVREKKKGELTRIGGLPPVHVEFEARRLEGGIGYIKFGSFLPIMKEKIRSAVATFKDAPGIVLDLRGNTGGLTDVMNAVAGSFVPQGTVIGMTKTRKKTTYSKAHSNGAPYSGPLVILVDELSRSASEGLAAGLQETERAAVVGETTAGADLDSDIKRLPTGALFMIPTGDQRTPKGVAIEGRGVIPDQEVKLTREALQSGMDHQLEEAVRYLRSKGSDPKKVTCTCPGSVGCAARVSTWP